MRGVERARVRVAQARIARVLRHRTRVRRGDRVRVPERAIRVGEHHEAQRARRIDAPVAADRRDHGICASSLEQRIEIREAHRLRRGMRHARRAKHDERVLPAGARAQMLRVLERETLARGVAAIRLAQERQSASIVSVPPHRARELPVRNRMRRGRTSIPPGSNRSSVDQTRARRAVVRPRPLPRVRARSLQLRGEQLEHRAPRVRRTRPASIAAPTDAKNSVRSASSWPVGTRMFGGREIREHDPPQRDQGAPVAAPSENCRRDTKHCATVMIAHRSTDGHCVIPSVLGP